MKPLWTKLSLICGVFIVALTSSIASANVTSVVVSPNQTVIQISSPAVVNLNWTVSSTPPTSPWTIASTQGEVLADGVLIATVAQTLSTVASGTAPVTVAFPETLNVPTAAIQTALNNGATTISYRRTFMDGSAFPQSAQVILTVQSVPPTVPSGPPTIISAQAVPGQVALPISQAANLTVNWAVNSDDPTQNQWTVFSDRGRLLADGVEITTVNQRLTQIVTAPQTVQISESAFVPLGALQAALNRGARSITYERTFRLVGGQSRTAVVRVLPQGDFTSEFSVNRLELSFDDNSLIRIIDRNETLAARLKINYSGSGLLQGAWQIADGVSTSGQPFFRTLRTVRRSLIPGQQVVLVSPELPSETSGTVLVRFMVMDPAFTADLPTLRYAVRTSALTQAGRAPRQIAARSPSPGGILNANTTFAWAGADNAFAYKVELYELTLQTNNPILNNIPIDGVPTLDPFGEGGATLVGGKYVQSSETQTNLGQVTLDLLSPGKVYAWRIVALNEGGMIIAASHYSYLVAP